MRRKKRNNRRREDQKDAVGGSFSFTRRGLRGGFWFLLSLLFATSAFALVPSSTPTAKEKNEETTSSSPFFTILRAEKWPNGGVRIFYSSPEKEESDKGENAAGKNTAVELSFQKEKEELTKNATDRERNLMVAIRLLPFFEDDPAGWAACSALNAKKDKRKRSFETYLRDWRNGCKKLFEKNRRKRGNSS